MPMTAEQAATVAADLIAAHRRTLQRNGSKGRVQRYLKGDHDLPFMPKGATAEFRTLARRSVTNWLPLISDTFTKGLFVDGYRPAKAAQNSKAWDYWQANGLDARQSVAHRGAIEFGQSFVLVLPGSPAPVIRPLHPLRTFVLFADPDDEYPAIALVRAGDTADGSALWKIYDAEAEYLIREPEKGGGIELVGAPYLHGLGVTPLVRFRDRLDGEACGVIEPVIAVQDRVNETVFALMIALQYASFRQRWATGLSIPVDTEPFLSDGVTANPNFGKPIETFEAAVDRLWITDNPDARFGDFAQTEVSGHLEAYLSAVRTLAALASTSPHVMLGEMSNVSGEALQAYRDVETRRGQEFETLFGEAWEQVFRLAGAAAGDAGIAEDESSEVRWRDAEPRAFGATIDGLGKMVQMLGVPAEGAWARIPGVTDQEIERWKAIRQEGDVMGALLGSMTTQAAPNPGNAPAATTPAAPTP